MNQLTYTLVILLSLPFYLNAQISENGYGENILKEAPCLSEEDRAAIKQLLKENIKALKLNERNNEEPSVVDNLIFPMKMPAPPPGYTHFHGISNYVDQDNSSAIQDYNCFNRSYDGHKGTDYFTFPFPWHLYENDLVQVVSAAPGTIILKQDGNKDTNCSPMGNWNAVYIQHSDGSIMWYGHLKLGSLTSKGIGATVEKGEYLGVVASSGNSTGAHLHIECYDANDKLLDPYKGNCNQLNANSLWENQAAHTTPKVNAVLTHNVFPQIECGPSNELAALANVFYPGDNLYVGVYLTDYEAGSIAITKIYRPDGSIYDTFNTFNNQNSYHWYWNFRGYIMLDNTNPGGFWTIKCDYKNVTYTHTFEFVNQATSVSEIHNPSIQLFPNPTNGIVNLKGIDLINEKYQLINGLGQIVKQGTIVDNKITLGNIPNGLYYLKIKNADLEILEKINLDY